MRQNKEQILRTFSMMRDLGVKKIEIDADGVNNLLYELSSIHVFDGVATGKNILMGIEICESRKK